MAGWYGMITWLARLTRTLETSTPRAVSPSSSPMRAAGLTTTPGPMRQVMWG